MSTSSATPLRRAWVTAVALVLCARAAPRPRAFPTRRRDGTPVDTSARHPASKRLTMKEDAETIANYSNPAWVLGWNPSAPAVK
jgi:hypothetical protein